MLVMLVIIEMKLKLRIENHTKNIQGRVHLRLAFIIQLFYFYTIFVIITRVSLHYIYQEQIPSYLKDMARHILFCNYSINQAITGMNQIKQINDYMLIQLLTELWHPNNIISIYSPTANTTSAVVFCCSSIFAV